MNKSYEQGREDYYRSLFEIPPASIIIEDGQGNILDVNPAFTRIFGYGREEVVGHPISILGVTDSNEEIQEHIRQILSGRLLRHVVKNRRKNGQECYFDLNETRISLPDGGSGIMVVANDITERVQATMALKESEGRLSAILSSMIDLVFAFDEEGRFVFYHAPSDISLQLPPEQFMGCRHEEVMPASVNEPFQRVFKDCRERGAITYTYSLECSSGLRWFSCKLSPITLDGIFRGAVAVVTDITEERRVAEALRLHSQVYRSIEEAVLVFDREGTSIDLNPAAEKLTGWVKSDLIGQKAEIMNPPDQGRKITQEINQDLVRQGFWEGEIPMLTRDGEQRTVFTVVSCLRDDQGEWVGNIGINRDITDQKRIEAELIRTQKLESLGVLAGGLAHDFNNLLMAIMGNAQLARSAVRGEDLELFDEIDQACHQAQALTRQLLTFARGGRPIKKTLDVAVVLKESAGFVLRGTNVSCDIQLAPELSLVEADPGQLSQVLNNLLINAAQAMPDGGRIMIAAENFSLDSESGPGRYVRVTIADQGEGIAPETLPKVFDPFFTTKPGGNGLGLTTSYSIIKNHGGNITITPNSDGGCTATLIIPASPAEAPLSARTETEVICGRGRILVVDDDPSVARITKQMLRRLGYRCETAPEGARALELYRSAVAAGDPFSAVILDLTVASGMGGRETMVCLKGIDPGVKALVASGYSNDPVLADYAGFGFSGMLPKPYELADLGRELARVLEG